MFPSSSAASLDVKVPTMDDALYVTHDQLLRNGDWVADRVIYSAKEVKVMPVRLFSKLVVEYAG